MMYERTKASHEQSHHFPAGHDKLMEADIKRDHDPVNAERISAAVEITVRGIQAEEIKYKEFCRAHRRYYGRASDSHAESAK